MKNIKNIAYVRGSTDAINLENQRFEIEAYCNNENIVIDEWVEETQSGAKDYSLRKLGAALEKCDKNCRIICTEISRIGRNLMSVFDFLNKCRLKGCQVWTIKNNFRFEDNLTSQVVAFAYSLSAQIERELIVQRTKEALALRKAQGVKLGAPRTIDNAVRQKVLELKHSGYSYRKIGKTLGIGSASACRIAKESN